MPRKNGLAICFLVESCSAHCVHCDVLSLVNTLLRLAWTSCYCNCHMKLSMPLRSGMHWAAMKNDGLISREGESLIKMNGY